ncbi:MAG: M23 family metallopeptidase [Bacteroidota bacterium]|nr:M23 family metallopeptidase [Bacteroidota bacterium]MDX5430710.1 M23 family metallopeptidase [Bacteroidota bacterium]MDX5469457.1 M23 family metallopeptidase [Bacteroidota bacterium]
MEQKKRLIHRLRSKYRLVIMNESTFEEKASLTLSKLNVFMVISSLLVFFFGISFYTLVYTPLREYLPGQMSKDQSQLLLELAYKIDSLETVIDANELMMQNNMRIMEDRPDTSMEAEGNDSLLGDVYLDPTEEELELRDKMNATKGYSLQAGRNLTGNTLFAPFYTPLNGLVSARFDPMIDHLATDIVSKDDQTVKSVLDGTVVLSSWTPETGHVMAIQHSNDLVSIYKHNSVLLKKVGNFVDAGEAIAIVGSSGEFSSGPHLHFELWHQGIALNAEEYMVFK